MIAFDDGFNLNAAEAASKASFRGVVQAREHCAFMLAAGIALGVCLASDGRVVVDAMFSEEKFDTGFLAVGFLPSACKEDSEKTVNKLHGDCLMG